MAIKTFTAGSVLTAADTNTYLANSGLVYVKSQTIGSGVSSVTVTDAFSATYDNYKVIISGGASSNQTGLSMRIGGSAIAYYGFYTYGTIGSATVFGANTSGGAEAPYVGGCDINTLHLNAEITSPYLAKATGITGLIGCWGNNRGTSVYDHEVASSFTSFTIAPLSGTITGGTITVYGYRKA